MRLGRPSPVACGCFLLFSLFSSWLLPCTTHAQTSQPYLFAQNPTSPRGMYTFLRDDVTGALTLMPNSASTFNDTCIPTVVDPKGRFLYGQCGDGLAMYTLDPTTAAIAEIPASPFAISKFPNSTNGAVIPESTGQYVYLVKNDLSGTDATQNLFLDTFQVDAATPTLIPVSSQRLDLVGRLNGIGLPDPRGHGVALVVAQNLNNVPYSSAVLYSITFDPFTGAPAFDPSGGIALGQNPRAWSISPTGNYLAVTYGVNQATLNVFQISSANFALSNLGPYPLGLDGTFVMGISLFFSPAAQMLYVQAAVPANPNDGLGFLLIDPSTYLVFPSSPLPFSDAVSFLGWVLDPQGPYTYAQAPNGGINVFYVDPASGRASQTGSISSPFYPQLGAIDPILASVGPTGGQGTSGPELSLSIPYLNFSQTTVGQSTPPQTVILKNAGNAPLNLTSISTTGTNVSDFHVTNNCAPVLTSNQSCSISVVYAPSASGASNASLIIISNAPQSPQSIALAGTGFVAPSHVTFSPASVLFPGAVTQGSSSNPITLTLTNTGGTPLHLVSTAGGGNNAPDFAFGSTNCSGTIAPNASCTISVTFTPLAAGLRSATWTVTDDAPDSPQVATITGNAVPAVQLGAASSGGNTSASVSPGQPAQFNLQATPSAGFTGTLTFTCSGVPFGAACAVPASLPVTNGAAAPFTVSIITLGSSIAVPSTRFAPPPLPFSPWIPLFTFVALVALLLAGSLAATPPRSSLRPAHFAIVILSLGLVISGIACGGGGSSTIVQPPPQSAATPSIQPAGGTFSAPQSVTITDTTSGAAIYYTVDGSAPTATSAVYSAPLSLNSAATVKAVAAASGFTNSSVASAAFAFRSPAGTFSVTVNATAIPSSSARSLPLNPIVLTLTVN